VTDDIRTLTARLAADPASLVFLDLGEALRRRGRLEAARAVAETGVQRHRGLPAAWDLLARVRSDQGDGDGAFDAWTEALRVEPGHLGALRGLAFLAYRAGDLARAERHLTRAAEAAPHDPALRAALDRLRRAPSSPPPASERELPTLLVDGHGHLLAGRLHGVGGMDVSDAVAAELALAVRDAARAADLLALGAWRGLSAEGAAGAYHLMPVTDTTSLLAVADPATPAARLALEATRAAGSARRWLERLP
jgi:tetratricopeptide (TPR) repeat protein